jgi:hypothetical protein
MKKHRTTFPGEIDFSGWWVKSSHGIIAQLTKLNRDLHGHCVYSLLFSNGQTGNGTHTMATLIGSGVTIRKDKKELDE